MGDFKGHILPGSFFFLFGIWWTYIGLKRYYKKPNNFQSSVAFQTEIRGSKRSIEAVLKIIACLIGIIGEIVCGFEKGVFKHLENAQHATMFAAFCLSSFIDLLTANFENLPKKLDYFAFVLAFVTEAIVFKFHIIDRPKIDAHLHTLLLYVILSTCVVLILEAYYRINNIILLLCRSYLCLLQGTWFWQIAFTLYMPRIVEKSNSAVDDSKMQSTLPDVLEDVGSEKENFMMLTMAFAWHMFMNFLLLIMIIIISALVAHRRAYRTSLQQTYEKVSTFEL